MVLIYGSCIMSVAVNGKDEHYVLVTCPGNVLVGYLCVWNIDSALDYDA